MGIVNAHSGWIPIYIDTPGLFLLQPAIQHPRRQAHMAALLRFKAHGSQQDTLPHGNIRFPSIDPDSSVRIPSIEGKVLQTAGIPHLLRGRFSHGIVGKEVIQNTDSIFAFPAGPSTGPFRIKTVQHGLVMPGGCRHAFGRKRDLHFFCFSGGNVACLSVEQSIVQDKILQRIRRIVLYGSDNLSRFIAKIGMNRTIIHPAGICPEGLHGPHAAVAE